MLDRIFARVCFLLANLPGYEGAAPIDVVAKDDVSRSAVKFDFYRLLPKLNVDSADVARDSYTQAVPAFRSNPDVATSGDLPEAGRILEVPASYGQETYFLQAGSFSALSDAEKMRAKLLLNGLDAFVKPFERDGRMLHRVRLGPYYGKNALNHARESLQNRGISYMVLRVKG